MKSSKAYIKSIVFNPIFNRIITVTNLLKNQNKISRKLEIGPGKTRINGFETLNIVYQYNVDYVWDATKKMPFKSNVFDIVYASHILEHVPWFLVENVLTEWIRILKPGGRLELWVPNAYKICNAFINAENGISMEYTEDGWFKFNPTKDPCVWAAGRIFTYGNGTRNICHPNWHRALFSERYLKTLLQNINLRNIETLDNSSIRGNDHGWINLGVSGVK